MGTRDGEKMGHHNFDNKLQQISVLIFFSLFLHLFCSPLLPSSLSVCLSQGNLKGESGLFLTLC